jgi:hypothetical protein
MAISNIIRGWGNIILDELDFLNPVIKEKAEERLNICDTCPLRTNNKCDKTKKGINIETGEEVYGCSCNLTAKALDPSSMCPLHKWKDYKL